MEGRRSPGDGHSPGGGRSPGGRVAPVQVAEAQHVDERVDVRLGGEVDARPRGKKV